jgi:phenylalanyl-tRNA synthetase beta chain
VRHVALGRRTLRRILGVEIPAAHVRSILERLDFPVEAESESGWTVRVPTFRRDVLAEEDLVEEVARGFGVARIPERAHGFTVGSVSPAPRWDLQQRSRRCLLGLGLTEVVTPGLVDGARHAALLPDDGFFGPGVPVRNPLSADRNRLRGSLVPGLLDVLATNRARGTADLALFEVGRTFRAGAEGGVSEHARAAALLAGTGAQPHWIGATKPSDFFDMKGTLEVYVERLVGETLRVVTSGFAPLSGNRSARVLLGAREIGRLGDVDARVRKSFDLPEDLPVFWAEWDLDELGRGETEDRLYEPLPRHPGAVRDLAFIVPRTVAHEALETSLRDSAGPLLSSIRLFDTYEGPPLGETEKSLAYTLVFRAAERSLTNDEVDGLVAAIVDGARRQIGARLR